MRCARCGAKMRESQRDTIFRGPITVYSCSSCGEVMKRFDGTSRFSSMFLSGNREDERIVRRADPVNFEYRS